MRRRDADQHGRLRKSLQIDPKSGRVFMPRRFGHVMRTIGHAAADVPLVAREFLSSTERNPGLRPGCG
ncbi:hypothetical protein B1810_07495 [Panacagrimonas perspica]|nr:hypothetical protein B1810_07495 [Panacagrimonas perspica]